MVNLGRMLSDLDFYSSDAKLRIQNGRLNFKTWFGGLLSFFTLLLIISSISFFLNRFFSRKEEIVVSNDVFTNEVQIENFSNYPFMIRISDSNGIVRTNPSRIWKFVLSYWWTERNLTDPSQNQVQKLEFIDMVKCDIKEKNHFNPEFVELFQNQTDIDTFMCPDYKKNYSLFGIYGDTNPFSYLHFYLRPCIKSIDNIECESDATIKNYLSAAYLDFRTINYAMNSHSKKPYNNIVHSERLLFSNTIFRRIWMYYKTIYYNTDFGIVFESIQKDKFFQIDSFKNDIDVRVVSGSGNVPFSFLRMTLSNLNVSSIYNRSYIKAMDFLANIGGIIKGLTTIGFILNYIISEKLFNLHLINHLPEILYLSGREETQESFDKVLFYEVKKSNLILNKSKKEAKVELENMANKKCFNSNKFIDQDQSTDKINLNKGILKKDIKDEDKSMKIRKINTEFNNFMNIKKNNDSNLNDSLSEYDNNNIKENEILDKINNNNIKIDDNNIRNNNQLGVNISDFIVEEEDVVRLSKYVKYIDPKITNEKKFDLSWYQFLIPDVLLSESNLKFKQYKKCSEYLNQELDIASIINRLNQFEKIKESLLTYDQSIIFNFLFKSKSESNNVKSKYYHNIEYSEFEKSFSYLKNKIKKDNIDEYLISNLII